MESDIHICGVLVQARPERLCEVTEAIRCEPAAEIHLSAADGRLVVVCETPGEAEMLALLERLRNVAGVVNIAPVYQHTEGASELEEVVNEDDPA